MASRANTPQWDSEGNLIVPRHGIGVAMAVALLAASVFFLFEFLSTQQWHRQHPEALQPPIDPFWLTTLWIALPLVPFLLSAVLLSRRGEDAKSAGAGFAAALSAGGLLFAIAAFLGEFLMFSPEAYAKEEVIAILTFAVCCVWILIAAFRIATRAGWAPFWTSAVGTLVFIVVAGKSLEKTKIALDHEQERQKAQTLVASNQTYNDARRILAMLAGCLIQYRATHPEAGFPATLAELPTSVRLPGGTVCNPAIADPGSVPEYTFTYTPRQDPSSSVVTDFLLLAMPLKKGLPRVDPMAVDRRGRIFGNEGWFVTDQQQGFVPRLFDVLGDIQRSGILLFKEEMRLFVKANGGTPPTMLSKMPDHSDKSAYNNDLSDGLYRLTYYPPESPDSKTYMISAVCQRYGDECLRSFLVDHDGEVHETSEPRLPTPQDPLIPDCEKFAQTCRDFEWPSAPH